MRIAKWCGLTALLLSVAGMCVSLMKYSLAGFPFGGASGIAEAQADVLRILWISLLCLVIGVTLVIVWWRANANRTEQKNAAGVSAQPGNGVKQPHD
jgi:hypothetical protein